MHDSKGQKANKWGSRHPSKHQQIWEVVCCVTVLGTWGLRLRIVRDQRPGYGVTHAAAGQRLGSGFLQ